MTDYTIYYDNASKFAEGVFLKAMTYVRNAGGVEEEKTISEDRKITIGMTVNGVPIDTASFFGEFQRNFSQMIETRARDIAEEKVNEKIAFLDDIADTVAKADEAIRMRVGITKDSWGYWDIDDKWAEE